MFKTEAMSKQREKAYRTAFSRGKADKDLDNGRIADVIGGVSRSTLSTYLREGPWKMEFGRFCAIAQTVGMTGREVCKIVGIPYYNEEEK